MQHVQEFLDYVAFAEILLEKIWASTDERWLLHGDLHHENILWSADSAWVAIDPKGVIGPRVLEYGRFMHNFMPDETQNVETVLEEKASALARIIPAESILRAGFLDLVLSVSWTLNEGQSVDAPKWELLRRYRKLL